MALRIYTILGLLFTLSAVAAPVDPTFTTDRIDSGNGKTKIESDSAGRLFVTEKQGRVLLYQPDGSGDFQTPPSVILDLSSQVDASVESGLLGLALDPEFDSNRHIYLFHTTTTDQRLIRYTANAGLTLLESPLILLSGLPRAAPFHKGGDIGFHPLDPDHLFVALGDDDNLTRPTDLDFYEGKILRISKTNGEGVSTNPFYDNNPASIRSRVWAQGFRNPFRFTFHPTRADVLFVSENGDATDRLAWVQRGSNGNWGPAGDTAFLNPTDPNFRILYSGSPSHVGVVIATSGPFVWNGGPTLYLSRWHPNGSILRFALSGADLDTATPIPDGNGTHYWENGAIAVDFELHADGNLYYTTTNGDNSLGGFYRLERYRKTISDPPVSSFSSSLTTAHIDTSISFTSNSTAGTAAIVEHLWDFGDGNQSLEINPVHSWASPGIYPVSLTVTDAGNLSHTSTESITITEPSTLDMDVTILDAGTGSAPVIPPVLSLLQSNGDLISTHAINASGRLVTNVSHDLTGPSVIVEISGTGYQTLLHEITGTSLVETFHIGGTAISGSVTIPNGNPIVVDLGLFSSGVATPFVGGRDYLIPFPPSGHNHRLTTDAFGRFYIPLGNTNTDYTIVTAEDTNRHLYASSQIAVSVIANQMATRDIVLGQRDGGEGRDDLSSIPVTPGVSYDSIQTIFSNNCTGCHRANTENSGGLDLTEGNSLAALLDQASNFVPGLTLVEPGSPSRSYLFEKINRATPQQGTRMRPSDTLPVSDQALIRDWIAQLAPTYESFLLETYHQTPDMSDTAPEEDLDDDSISNVRTYLDNFPGTPTIEGDQFSLPLESGTNDPKDLTIIVEESSDLSSWYPIAIRISEQESWQAVPGLSIDDSTPGSVRVGIPMDQGRSFYRVIFEW